MRVAVLAYPLRLAGGLSVGRNVVAALGRVADEHEYLLLLPADVGYEETDKPSRAECHYYRRVAGLLGQLLYEGFTVPKLVGRFLPDVVWGLANFGLAAPGAPQAVLFQKAQYVYARAEYQPNAGWAARASVALGRRRLRRSLPATQLVFCQTQTTARRFQQVFEYGGRIAVMPNAVSRFALQQAAPVPPPVFRQLEGKHVLLCLTKYYTHKNLEMLVELFRADANDLADVGVIFTVHARQHRRARQFLKSLADPKVRDRLVNVGPVEQSELAAYYTHSDGLILPTLLESFSGTYLEAMKFQCPILTSDLDFAHDVCGDAAEYFDPRDPASIRQAVLNLKGSPARRAELIRASSRRLETFVRDWDSIVAEAMDSIQSLCVAPVHNRD